VTRTRRTLLAALLASLLTAVAGCGAGFDAQTNQVYTPADGVRVRAGDIELLNVLVVAPARPESGKPAEGGSTASASPEPGDATGVLMMTVANRGQRPDSLAGVQARDVGGASTDGPKEVAPRGVLRVGTGADDARVTLRGLKVKPGGIVELRVVFAGAGAIVVKVPVVAAEGDYANITASPEPTPSGTPQTTASTTP
jgi:hypothetical protein